MYIFTRITDIDCCSRKNVGLYYGVNYLMMMVISERSFLRDFGGLQFGG